MSQNKILIRIISCNLLKNIEGIAKNYRKKTFKGRWLNSKKYE